MRLLVARDDLEVNSKDEFNWLLLEPIVIFLATRDDVDVNSKDKYGLRCIVASMGIECICSMEARFKKLDKKAPAVSRIWLWI